MKKVIDELQTLMDRVQPILDKIDLNRDVTETIDLAISLGTYPSIVPGDLAKKLMVLKYQGKITNAEMITILSSPTNSD